MEDFYCKYCDYQAKNKYTFKKHLQTKKHAKNLELYQEKEKEEEEERNYSDSENEATDVIDNDSVVSSEIVYGSDQEDDEEYDCPEGEQDDYLDELLEEEYQNGGPVIDEENGGVILENGFDKSQMKYDMCCLYCGKKYKNERSLVNHMNNRCVHRPVGNFLNNYGSTGTSCNNAIQSYNGTDLQQQIFEQNIEQMKSLINSSGMQNKDSVIEDVIRSLQESMRCKQDTVLSINGRICTGDPFESEKISNSIFKSFAHPFFKTNQSFIPMIFLKNDEFRLHFNKIHNVNITKYQVDNSQELGLFLHGAINLNTVRRMEQVDTMDYLSDCSDHEEVIEDYRDFYDDTEEKAEEERKAKEEAENNLKKLNNLFKNMKNMNSVQTNTTTQTSNFNFF